MMKISTCNSHYLIVVTRGVCFGMFWGMFFVCFVCFCMFFCMFFGVFFVCFLVCVGYVVACWALAGSKLADCCNSNLDD